jgi:hypothetical protein
MSPSSVLTQLYPHHELTLHHDTFEKEIDETGLADSAVKYRCNREAVLTRD